MDCLLLGHGEVTLKVPRTPSTATLITKQQSSKRRVDGVSLGGRPLQDLRDISAPVCDAALNYISARSGAHGIRVLPRPWLGGSI
jgi:hypothetical protein